MSRESFKSCPRVGGINKFFRLLQKRTCFKSCPRVGGIRQRCRCSRPGRGVSSRAPVWGASCFGKHTPKHRGSFKSCPRVGGIRS